MIAIRQRLKDAAESGISDLGDKSSEMAGTAFNTALESNCIDESLDLVTLWLENLYAQSGHNWAPTSIFAFELFEVIAEALERQGYNEPAGRARSSQAEAALRISPPDPSLLNDAQKALDRALALRVDSGPEKQFTLYTKARIDIAACQTKEAAALKASLKRLRHSYRALRDANLLAPIQKVDGLTEMIRTESTLVRKHRHEMQLNAMREHRHEIVETLDVDDETLCEMISSIPRELGFESTPLWFPSWADTLVVHGERWHTALIDVHEIESVIAEVPDSPHLRTVGSAQEAVCEFFWVADPKPETLETYIDCLLRGGSQDTLSRTVELLQVWSQARSLLPEINMDSLSKMILESYTNARKVSSGESIASFHFKHSLDLRFVAGYFAERENYPPAVELLQMLQLDQAGRPPSIIPAGHYRIYIIHDPFNSHIISQNWKGDFEGRTVEVGGKRLAAGWLSIFSDVRGATIAETTMARRDSDARFQEEIQYLEEVVHQIVDLVPEGCAILLEPFGIFHHAPLGALIEQLAPSKYVLVAEVRASDGTEMPTSNRLTAFKVNSPTMPALPSSAGECDVIAHAAKPSYAGASCDGLTREGLSTALKSDRVVHISGHAEASMVYPFESRLFLDDDAYSSLEILKSAPYVSEFVYLNACQSSLNIAGYAQESGLTPSGALAFGGVGCVLGTTRKLLDTPAALFAVYFYQIWDGNTSPYSVYHALAATQEWMRCSSVREIIDFNESLAQPLPLPSNLPKDQDSAIFRSASFWSPYMLTVADIALADLWPAVTARSWRFRTSSFVLGALKRLKFIRSRVR